MEIKSNEELKNEKYAGQFYNYYFHSLNMLRFVTLHYLMAGCSCVFLLPIIYNNTMHAQKMMNNPGPFRVKYIRTANRAMAFRI